MDNIYNKLIGRDNFKLVFCKGQYIFINAMTKFMQKYFIPPNKTTSLIDEWRKLKQDEGVC